MKSRITVVAVLVLAAFGGRAEWCTSFCAAPTWGAVDVMTNTPAETYIDFYRFKYPATVKRHHGFTIASRGVFTAKTDGTYRFRFDGRPSTGGYRVLVDGYFLDQRPGAVNQTNLLIEADVPLRAGKVPITIYCKSVGSHCARMKLFAKAPGAADFALVDPEPATGVTPETPLVSFDREFRLEEGALRYAAYRTWTFDVPEAGFYELAARMTMVPRFVKMCLDGSQFMTWTERSNVKIQDCFWHLPDRTGSKHVLRLDFFNNFRKVFYLEKGRHTFDAMAMQNAWLQGDDMPKLMGDGTVRFGLNRLRGKNAADETAFELEGRPDSMVFERGRGFTFVARTADSSCRTPHTFVVRTVRETNEVFRQAFALDGTRAVKVAYPAPDEGAFEYYVLNDRGETVEGPWAFAVADPTPLKRPRSGTFEEPKLVKVDEVDCTVEGPGGPHEFREQGKSEVFDSPVGKYRRTGPVCGKTWRDEKRRYQQTFDWYAYTLKVRNPHRCHVVRVKVPNDIDRFNTVMAFDRKSLQHNGWVIRSGVGPETGDWSDLEFFVWPNTDAIDVMVLHGWVRPADRIERMSRRSAARSIAIYEYEGGAMPVLPEAREGWQEGRSFGWYGEQTDLYVTEHMMPRLWQDDTRWAKQGDSTHIYRTWQDISDVWERFGELAMHRGDSLCWVPAFTYNMQLLGGEYTRLMWPSQDPYIYQSPYAEIADPCDRDVFMLALMKANKYGVRLVADFMPQRLYPEAWASYHGMPGETNGFYLTENAAGKIHAASWTATPIMNPCHPLARKHFVTAYRALGRRYGRYPAFAGVRLRQWGGVPGTFEPTWQNADLGFDDYTVAKFAADEGLADLKSVGRDEAAFTARRELIRRKYLDRWNRWRGDKVFSMYEEMLAALREGAPQARIWGPHISATNDQWGVGRGLDPERYKNRRDLGYVKGQVTIRDGGVELGGFYPPDFAAFNVRPGVYANPTNLPSRLTYPSSICCNSSYHAAPYHLKEPALALADGALVELYAGGEWCPPPPNESLRRFVRTYRAIPDLKYVRLPLAGADAETVSVWSGQDAAGDTWVYVVNRTDLARPVTIELDSRAFSATDAVSGETSRFTKKLEARLDAFMPAVWRLSGRHTPVAAVLPVTPRERERIARRYDHLVAMEAPAKDFVERRLSTDTRREVRVDDFGGCDLHYRLDELLKPIKALAAQGKWREVAKAIDAFDAGHRGFYEAFGWPTDYYRPRSDAIAPWPLAHVVKAKAPVPVVKTWDVGESRLFPEIDPKREFHCLRKGERFTLKVMRADTLQQILYEGLFGGGYGPVRVESDGKVIGRFAGGTTAEPRLEVRQLPVMIDAAKVREITLVPEGEKGAAIMSVIDTQVIGEPVAKWSYSTDGGKTWRETDLKGRRLLAFDKLLPASATNVLLKAALKPMKHYSYSISANGACTAAYDDRAPFFTLKADYFRNGPKYNIWCYGHAMPGANGAELRVTSARPEKGPWLFGLAINMSEENQGKAKR